MLTSDVLRQIGTLSRDIQFKKYDLQRNQFIFLTRICEHAGISFKTDGSMSVDSKKLSEALADPAKKIGELFAGNGTIDGFAKTLETRVKGMLDTDGLLSARTEGINRSIKSFDSRIESLEARLVRVEARYSAQFTALDAAMSSMNTTSAYLTQQLANL